MVAIVNPVSGIGAVGRPGSRLVTTIDRLDDARRGMKVAPQVRPLPDTDDAKRAKRITDLPDPDQSTIVGRGMDHATALVGAAGMATMLVPPLGGGVGRATGWVGRKTGASFLERAGNAIQKPFAYVEKTTPAAFAGSDFGKTFGRATQSVFNRVGDATEAVSKWTGADTFMQRRHRNGMFKQFARAPEFANVNFSAAHETLRPHYEEMHSILTKGVPGRAELDKLGELSKKLNAAKEAIPAGAEAIVKSGQKEIASFEHYAGKVLDHHQSVGRYENIGASIKKIPEHWSNRSLRDNVEYGAWFGLSGLSIINTARSAWKDRKLRAQFKEEIKGVDSQLVSKSFWHNLKTFVAREGIELASLAILARQARGGHIGGAIIAAQIGGSMGIEALMGESPLAAYRQFSAARRAGQLSAAEYAHFIGEIDPNLKQRGGADSPVTQKLAEMYFNEKADVRRMVEESGNGKMMWHAHEIMRANEAARAAHPEKTVSHVERLNGAKAQQHQVVGKHTDNVLKRAAQAGEVIEGVTHLV